MRLKSVAPPLASVVIVSPSANRYSSAVGVRLQQQKRIGNDDDEARQWHLRSDHESPGARGKRRRRQHRPHGAGQDIQRRSRRQQQGPDAGGAHRGRRLGGIRGDGTRHRYAARPPGLVRLTAQRHHGAGHAVAERHRGTRLRDRRVVRPVRHNGDQDRRRAASLRLRLPAVRQPVAPTPSDRAGRQRR